MVKFCMTIMQLVPLHGADSWVMTKHHMTMLWCFSLQEACHMMEMHICQDGDNNKAQDSSHSQMSEGLVILTEELKSNQINSIWKANPEKVNIVFCLPGGVSRGIIAAISYLDLDLFCQLWPIKQFQLSLAWGSV